MTTKYDPANDRYVNIDHTLLREILHLSPTDEPGLSLYELVLRVKERGLTTKQVPHENDDDGA